MAHYPEVIKWLADHEDTSWTQYKGGTPTLCAKLMAHAWGFSIERIADDLRRVTVPRTTRASKLRERITAYLTEHGPTSLLELVDRTGLNYNAVRSTIFHTRKKLGPGHFFVAGYVPLDEFEGKSPGKPSPIWAAGLGEDAPKPEKLPKKVVDARYNRRHRLLKQLKHVRSKGGPLHPFAALIKSVSHGVEI